MNSITRTHVVLLLVTMAWGLNNTAIKLSLREIDPLGFYVIRGAMSVSAIVFLFLLTRQVWHIERRDIGRLVLLAVGGVTANQLFFTIGMNHTTASNASLLMSTSPIFGLIFGILLAQEQATLRRWTGVFVALFGVALIITGRAGGFSFGMDNLSGDLIVMGAPIAWALYSVLARPILKTYSAIQLTTYGWLIGYAAGLPITIGPAFEQQWSGLAPVTWIAVAYASLCIPFTTVVWNKSVVKLGASAALVFMYFVPVFAVLAAVLFLQETLSILQIVGAAVVLIGINTARK